ncbi:hypothetical protein ACRAVF_24040 [Bradyrhizobium oligotrophicum S58]
MRLPINLLTPTPSVVDPDVKPTFVAPFAQMIDTWRGMTKPTTAGHARVEIELKVFGGVGDATQPLIQVGRLTHEVATA